MKNYSFFCDDAEGSPQYSEVRAFPNAAAAQSHARDMLPEVGRIELWCEGVLIHTLYNGPHPSAAEKAAAAANARLAFLSADCERTSARFDFLKSSTSNLAGVQEFPNSLRSSTSASSVSAFMPSVWLPLEPRLPKQ